VQKVSHLVFCPRAEMCRTFSVPALFSGPVRFSQCVILFCPGRSVISRSEFLSPDFSPALVPSLIFFCRSLFSTSIFVRATASCRIELVRVLIPFCCWPEFWSPDPFLWFPSQICRSGFHFAGEAPVASSVLLCRFRSRFPNLMFLFLVLICRVRGRRPFSPSG
jgi:hypothetical protein